MKLITNKQQKKIDELNIKKIQYAMTIIHKQHNQVITEEETQHYKTMASNEQTLTDYLNSQKLSELEEKQHKTPSSCFHRKKLI